ncbi:MAG: DEAD/DEAH box helicase [Dehalococcoidales bacterium]|nr:DEAD/DEAH box helicase [Dehalococcoidales bacterium]
MSFEIFNFHPSVMAGVRALGYVTPTPIQLQSIPSIMQGRDIIGLAQTGTGKTAAFALPILHRLQAGKRGQLRALVISPTRELAEQTCDAFTELGQKTGLRNVAIYGGVGKDMQIRKLRAGAEIAVGCPGRLLDHLYQGALNLSHLDVLVIDEADRMFDMGFLPDIKRILECILQPRQTLLFSATMPDDIRRLVKDVLHNPVNVQIGQSAPATSVSHALYPVRQDLKTALLLELLYQTKTDSVLVFVRTKHRVERLAEQLYKSGHSVASLQGNLSQQRRQAALDGFRSGSIKILVATDIAARGIDVLNISHVINFDMPENVDAYIHRIGRTGRVDETGEAFTFVTHEDMATVRDIEKVLNKPIERRTLEGFDYKTPSVEKEVSHSPRPMRKFPVRRQSMGRKPQFAMSRSY